MAHDWIIQTFTLAKPCFYKKYRDAKCNFYFPHSLEDFEIALDQERKIAVPFPQDDEIAHLTNIQRVAVICAPASAFCLGSVHPKDRLALKVRHLKTLGYQVALVAEHEFGRLSEDERVVFLKNAIFGE